MSQKISSINAIISLYPAYVEYYSLKKLELAKAS